ncbi:MAG TPA: TonB family protein [Bryobacteraceae bacterium]
MQRDLRRIGVFLALGVGLVALLFVSIGNLYRTELRSFLSPVKAAAPREPLPDAVPQKVAASANPVGPQDQNLSSAPPVTPMRIAKPMPGKPMLRGRISPAAARVVEFKAPASPRPPLLTPPKPATNAATNSAPKVVDQIPASSTPPTASAEPAQRPQDSSAAITGGRLLHRVDPVYPDEARLNRLQGTVALHAFIAEDGSVQEVSVVSGDPDLARAAVQAVSQWRYEPYSIAGKVTRVAVDITVDFKLP